MFIPPCSPLNKTRPETTDLTTKAIIQNRPKTFHNLGFFRHLAVLQGQTVVLRPNLQKKKNFFSIEFFFKFVGHPHMVFHSNINVIK